jgi:hypothetical protein
MLTVLDIFMALQYDLNKEEAPAMYPSDFTHHLNKAVNNYVNKRYNMYDATQQTTDDLRVLSTNVEYRKDVSGWTMYDRYGVLIGSISPSFTSDGISFVLPSGYRHALNAIAGISKKGYPDKCKEPKLIVKQTNVKRLTSDMFQSIVDDWFQRPTERRPYYFIRENQVEIRCGNAELVSLKMDYLGDPIPYLLTPEQVNIFNSSGTDTSQLTGFPKYVNYEILREVLTMVLARDVDPRIQTLPQVTQSIP